MTSPCNCKDSALQIKSSLPAITAEKIVTQDFPAECSALTHETVCIKADITIHSLVDVGEIQSFCTGSPFIGVCPGTPSPTGKCSFTVSQSICVQVPLNFSAAAAAKPTGIICGELFSGSCPSTPTCTHTIGYYGTHPGYTNALITAAGGSIVLGTGNLGASFTVTTSNANDVLSFNTPSPPAPSSPPFAQQYQNLYAQLLAAHLNILTGATCDFAFQAITAANTFIETSPSGIGKAGAPAVQAPLEEFNSGTAPECPAHC